MDNSKVMMWDGSGTCGELGFTDEKGDIVPFGHLLSEMRKLRAEVIALRARVTANDAVKTNDNLVAAGGYRKSVMDRADGTIGPFPVWHGWVILEAFLAGCAHQKCKTAEW